MHLLKNAIASTKHLLIVAHPLVFELVMTFPSIYLTLPFITVTCGDGDGGGVTIMQSRTELSDDSCDKYH